MDDKVQRAIFLHLPHHRKIDIEFNDISFTVSQGRKESKDIVKGVCGKFRSGELTAIMGPSGAGKTSLLNILTGFQSDGIKGIVNNIEVKKKQNSNGYKKQSCYILQDDRLAPLYSVHEIMTIAANLKLGSSISEKSREYVIDDILETLGLIGCKNTMCSRLSGGQKKRLSIALELIDNPPVMFLDEPTTGLDSLSSLHCITLLKSLARGGRTIVCTIHQPSANVYYMFDHVYVLAKGVCVYQGGSKKTVDYLSSVGLHCPKYHNPADYLLEVANGDYGNFTEQLSIAATDSKWREDATSDNLKIEKERTIQQYNSTTDGEDEMKAMVLVNKPSEWSRLCVLIRRSFLQLYRDWTVTHLKVLLHIMVGILVGMLFYNVGNDASRVISNFGYFMVTLVYLCYTSMIPAVLRFPSEIQILKKERFNNWYNLKTYYCAFMIVNIPMQILFSSLYATISYFMTSQPQELCRFLMFLSICMLLTVTAEGIGILLGTLVNPVNGTFLGAISMAVTLVMAGVLLFLSHMSQMFYIISFVSYMRFALEGLTSAVYGFNREAVPCPEDIVFCRFTRPKTMLKELGLSHVQYWVSAVILLGIFTTLKIGGYYTLKRSISKS